jgi:hypothetical protein
MLNGEEPTEPELTVTYIEAASPRVRYAQFNPREEGSTGADWLWWFLDKSGACFGMLIQAKKLKRIDAHWRIDFGFVSGDELQLNKLLRSSNHLDVPAVYVLYCGDRGYRRGLTCGAHHNERICAKCASASVSALPGLCARYIHEWQLGAPTAFRMATSVEDLVTPGAQGSAITDLNLNCVEPALKQFLLAPQSGSREVAKKVFAMTSELRKGQYVAASSTMMPVRSDRVFESFPADRGHYGVSYFDNILRGLKPRIPDEVQEAMNGNPDALLRIHEELAGIAVFEF